jgi:hypothetical protein
MGQQGGKQEQYRMSGKGNSQCRNTEKVGEGGRKLTRGLKI